MEENTIKKLSIIEKERRKGWNERNKCIDKHKLNEQRNRMRCIDSVELIIRFGSLQCDDYFFVVGVFSGKLAAV